MSRVLQFLPPRKTDLELREVRLVLGDTGADGRLVFRGTLILGPDSDGIDPRNEPVALTVVDERGELFAALVPPGQFQLEHGRYVFRDPQGGLANGVELLRVESRDQDSYRVYAEARGIDLTAATAGTITVTLAVGDDVAARAGAFRSVVGKVVYP